MLTYLIYNDKLIAYLFEISRSKNIFGNSKILLPEEEVNQVNKLSVDVVPKILTILDKDVRNEKNSGVIKLVDKYDVIKEVNDDIKEMDRSVKKNTIKPNVMSNPLNVIKHTSGGTV